MFISFIKTSTNSILCSQCQFFFQTLFNRILPFFKQQVHPHSQAWRTEALTALASLHPLCLFSLPSRMMTSTSPTSCPKNVPCRMDDKKCTRYFLLYLFSLQSSVAFKYGLTWQIFLPFLNHALVDMLPSPELCHAVDPYE